MILNNIKRLIAYRKKIRKVRDDGDVKYIGDFWYFFLTLLTMGVGSLIYMGFKILEINKFLEGEEDRNKEIKREIKRERDLMDKEIIRQEKLKERARLQVREAGRR